MANACNIVTSYYSVKTHKSQTTETVQVADLPEMVGPSEVAGVDLGDQWRFSVNSKIHPPLSA